MADNKGSQGKSSGETAKRLSDSQQWTDNTASKTDRVRSKTAADTSSSGPKRKPS